MTSSPAKVEQVRTQDSSRGGQRRPGWGLLENLESVALVLILTLILRGSVMEAYVIPTGSMAPTLLGRHASLRCGNCGYHYDRGIPGSTQGNPSGRSLSLSDVYCPNDLQPAALVRRSGPAKLGWVSVCLLLSGLVAAAVYALGRWGYRDEQFGRVGGLVVGLFVLYLLVSSLQPWRGGDRILVNKLYYHFHPPSRWDVIVFKSPEEISRQFIKRLVAVPGDRVQILDGDVIINGSVSRKPAHVQRAVWRLVYDQAYQPGDLNRTPWEGPEGRYQATAQEVVLLGRSSGGGPSADPVEVRFVREVPGRGTVLRDILDHSGYNRGLGQHVVGDLRVQGELALEGDEGAAWVGIDHDDRCYRLRLLRSAEGGSAAELLVDGQTVAGPTTLRLESDGAFAVELSKVDYLLRARVEGVELGPVDLWTDASEVQLPSRSSRVLLGAEGLDCRASGLRIDRDLYYTGSVRGSDRLGDGTVVMGPGEQFVLGDNSPDSRDSRDWKLPRELYGLVSEVLDGEAEDLAASEARLLRYGLKAVEELLDAAYSADGSGQERVLELLAALAPEGPRVRPGEDLQETLARWQEWWQDQERSPGQIVPEENLLGKPFLVFWPLPRVGLIR